MTGADPEEAALKLEVHPDDVRRLLRHPALRVEPAGRARGTDSAVTWHDTERHALAHDGLALSETAKTWRLERLRGGLVAAAPTLDALGLDGAPHPIARFAGRDRRIPLGRVALTIRSGTIWVGQAAHPCHRLALIGPPVAVAALAERLAADLRVQAPAESLAGIAVRLGGASTPAPPLGAPQVPSGSTAAEAFAHVAAHLAATIRHWCGRIGVDASPEPVHQARVAVRRLRSALSLFRPILAGPDGARPDIARLDAALRALAVRLGTVRDWDVFLHETCASVQAAFTGDRRLARLGSMAARRRGVAHAALALWLESPEFRVLGVTLAGLGTVRPWAEGADRALLAEDITAFAAHLLARRRRKLLKAGKTIAGLPAETLHGLRKRCKKLRYGCEFFGPLFPKSAKRILRRLSKLQESLGHLNDGATAAALLAELDGGRARSFASGAVEGFTIAKAGDHRASIQRRWARFRREPGFWEKRERKGRGAAPGRADAAPPS